MRILVVDDEPLIVMTLSAILRKSGFEVGTAGSVGDAIGEMAGQTPDLVICDLDMPGRDGVELMRHMGAHVPGCPILVLTGHYRGISRVQGLAETLPQRVDVMTKPCPPVELIRQAGLMMQVA